MVKAKYLKQLKVHHLSDLPDDLLITILSLLPTHIAARTSVLSRRFRHLWKASPFLNLCSQDLPPTYQPFNFTDLTQRSSNFVDMVNCALFGRNPFHALFSLHLDLFSYFESRRTDSFIASLLVKAHSHGMRHLTIERFRDANIQCIFVVIFSMDTLTSLSLDCLPHRKTIEQFDLFSMITLTHLRTLSLRLCETDDLSLLNRLLSPLCSLDYLQLTLKCMTKISLSISSQTIKKLELSFLFGYPILVTLSLPSLKSLYWDNHGRHMYFPYFLGQIPLLTKVVISLTELMAHKYHVSGVSRLLSYISHVEDLTLHVKEKGDEKYPTPTLLEAAKVAFDLPNLKNVDAKLCCHENNIRAIITILAKSPALESLKLVHEIPELTDQSIGRNKSDWRSKLQHHKDNICHQNLHLHEKKKELVNFLMRCLLRKHRKTMKYYRQST